MKFKLKSGDAKSLKNSVSMIENPVLNNAAVEVSDVLVAGGILPPSFAKVEYLQVIWAQA